MKCQYDTFISFLYLREFKFFSMSLISLFFFFCFGSVVFASTTKPVVVKAAPTSQKAIKAVGVVKEKTKKAAVLIKHINVNPGLSFKQTFEAGEQKSYQFKVKTDGFFQFATFGSGDSYCSLYDLKDDFVASNDNGGRYRNCKILRFLKKGTYRLYVRYLGKKSTISVLLSRLVIVDLLEGTVSKGELPKKGVARYFRVRLLKATNLSFFTQGSIDTRCHLLNSKQAQLLNAAYDDDSGLKTNCRLNWFLPKGEHLFKVDSFRTGSFSAQYKVLSSTTGAILPLNIGALNTGRLLSLNRVQRFQFRLIKQQRMSFFVNLRGARPQLVLYDHKNKMLNGEVYSLPRIHRGSNALLSRTLAPGSYQLELRATKVPRGAYQLWTYHEKKAVLNVGGGKLFAEGLISQTMSNMRWKSSAFSVKLDAKKSYMFETEADQKLPIACFLEKQIGGLAAPIVGTSRRMARCRQIVRGLGGAFVYRMLYLIKKAKRTKPAILNKKLVKLGVAGKNPMPQRSVIVREMRVLSGTQATYLLKKGAEYVEFDIKQKGCYQFKIKGDGLRSCALLKGEKDQGKMFEFQAGACFAWAPLHKSRYWLALKSSKDTKVTVSLSACKSQVKSLATGIQFIGSVAPEKAVTLPLKVKNSGSFLISVQGLAEGFSKVNCHLDGTVLSQQRFRTKHYCHQLFSLQKGKEYRLKMKSSVRATPLRVLVEQVVISPLVLGKEVKSSILKPLQVRYFRFEVKKIGSYIFETQSPGSNLDTHCSLRNSKGKIILKNDDSGSGRNCLIRSLLAPGIYQVDIRTASARRLGHFTASVRYKPVPMLREKQKNHGILSRKIKSATFLVQIQKAGVFKFQTASPASNVDPRCQLFDRQMKKLAADDDSGPGRHCLLQLPLSSGSYIFKVGSFLSSRRGPFTLSFERLKTPLLKFGLPISGVLKATGSDLYQLKIVREGGYVIESSSRSSTDPKCFLLSAKGTKLSFDDDSGEGRNCRLATLLKPGTYWIKVKVSFRTRVGVYRLRVRTLPLTNLKLNQEQPVNANSTFLFRVPKDGAYQLYTKGGDSSRNKCELLNRFGKRLLRDSKSGFKKNCLLQSYLKAGFYLVRASALGRNVKLKFEQGTLQSLRLGQIVTGGLKFQKPGSIFQFSIKKRGKYIAETRNLGLSLDTKCFIFSLEGKAFGYNDNSGLGKNCYVRQRLKPGKYWLLLQSSGYKAKAPAKFKLSIRPFGTPYSPVRSLPLGLTKVIEGQLKHRTDVHSYQVQIIKRGVYVFDTRTPFSRADSVCFLSDGKKILSSNDDSGPGSNCKIKKNLDPGIYFLRVAPSYSIGKYQVSARPVGQRFPLIKPILSVNHLRLGVIKELRLERRGSQKSEHVYQVQIKKLDWYRFESITTGSSDPKCELFSMQGRRLVYDDDSGEGRDCVMDKKLSVGTYLFKVKSSSRYRSGPTKIVFHHLWQDTPGKSSPVKTLAVGKVAFSKFKGIYGLKRFQFRITKKKSYKLATKRYFSSIRPHCFLFKLSANGSFSAVAPIAQSFVRGGSKPCSFKGILNVGLYELRVTSASSYYKGQFGVSVFDASSSFPKIKLSLSKLIIGRAYSSRIGRDGRNYKQLFSLKIKVRGRYRIETRVPSSKADPVCSLYSANHTRIERNDDSGPGRNCLINRVLVPGQYIVEVSSASSYRKGVYQVAVLSQGTSFPAHAAVSVKTPAVRLAPIRRRSSNILGVLGARKRNSRVLRHGLASSTTKTLSVGKAYHSSLIRKSIVEIISVKLSRPGMYRIETTGGLDPKCYLDDIRGGILALDDDSGWAGNCKIRMILPSGSYRLRVWVRLVGQSGRYGVKLVKESP